MIFDIGFGKNVIEECKLCNSPLGFEHIGEIVRLDGFINRFILICPCGGKYIFDSISQLEIKHSKQDREN
jgi:hypothetical protein